MLRFRRLLGIHAALFLVATSLTAQDVTTPEIPKNATKILARTSADASGAYRAAIQGLIARGFMLQSSDATALIASTEAFAWDGGISTIQLNLLVSSDSLSTFVQYSGFHNWNRLGKMPLKYGGNPKSPAMRAWNAFQAIASEKADAGVEFRP